MITANDVKETLRSLRSKINKETGIEHKTVSEGVETLVLGYGAGDTEDYDGTILIDGEVPEDTVDLYESGKLAERMAFMSSYQENGDRKNCMYLFAGPGWNDATFRPVYAIRPEQGMSMFYNSKITNLEKILNDCGVPLDISQARYNSSGKVAAGLGSWLYGSSITHLPVLKPPTDTATMGAICNNATELVSIRGFDLSPWWAVVHSVEGVEYVDITVETVDFEKGIYCIHLSEALDRDITITMMQDGETSDGNYYESYWNVTITAGTTSQTIGGLPDGVTSVTYEIGIYPSMEGADLYDDFGEGARYYIPTTKYIDTTLEVKETSPGVYEISLSEAVDRELTVNCHIEWGVSNGVAESYDYNIAISEGTTTFIFDINDEVYWDDFEEGTTLTSYDFRLLPWSASEWGEEYNTIPYTLIDDTHARFQYEYEVYPEVDTPRLSYPTKLEFSTNAFANCTKLEEIHSFFSSSGMEDYTEAAGEGKEGYYTYYYLGLIHNYINVSACPNLSRETLLRISEALVNYRHTGDLSFKSLIHGRSGTCIFGATNLAKLTDEEITAITNKGWTVS